MIELNRNTYLIKPNGFRNKIYYSNLAQYQYNEYISNFSIKYCVKGEEHYIIDGRDYKIKKGQYIVVNEGSRVIFFTKNRSEGFSIFLDSKIISRVIDFNEGLEDDFQKITFYNKPLPTVDELGLFLKSTLNRSNNLINYKESYFYDIAERVISSQNGFIRKLKSMSQIKFSTREEIIRRLYFAIEYINDSPNKIFDLDVISSISCLSKYHFSRLFKEIYGMTPWNYHFEIKMNYCKSLLINNTISIRELSEKLGYSSISAFSRSFKNYHGYAPSFFEK